MNFENLLLQNFNLQTLEYILRVLVAGLCGMFVGMERKNRAKEAGTRTHFVVACGAALIMVISKYAFFDVVASGDFVGADVRLDPSRVASTIASGIGFLGAGMIYIYRNSIKGLTTAAGIWTTSGIGMAIGSGLYVLGITATVLVLLAQFLLHLNFGRDKSAKVKILTVEGVSEENYQSYMMEYFDEKGITVQDVSVQRNAETGQRNYTFYIDMPKEFSEDDTITRAGYTSSIKSSF